MRALRLIFMGVLLGMAAAPTGTSRAMPRYDSPELLMALARLSPGSEILRPDDLDRNT